MCDIISPDLVYKALRTIHDDFTRWGIPNPRIVVAGLNAHAYGEEDKTQIAPGVERARAEGINVTGPAPPDSVFRWCIDGQYDVVLAMYHDQGHIAVKTWGFVGNCAMILGMPHIHMSVAHGNGFRHRRQGYCQPRDDADCHAPDGEPCRRQGLPQGRCRRVSVAARDVAPLAAVLLDLDGTLADTAADLAHALNRLRDEQGMAPLAVSELRPYVSQGARGMLACALDIGPQDADYARLRDRFLTLYADSCAREATLFEGFADVLGELRGRGLRIGIVTNKLERFAAPLLRALGVWPDADCLITPDLLRLPEARS